jgi:multidrug resistance protein MdtO
VRSGLLGTILVELAPVPGRGRATLRIVVACVLATLLVMTLRIPHGHWLIITIFVVSQSDAGASLEKGILRIAGTLLGGLLGILTIAAFADQPWVRVPLVGVLAASGLYLSRTTTAPYLGYLDAITVLLVLTAPASTPEATVTIGLWRIANIALGVVLGVGAQLLLWPDDPEKRLVDELERRLGAVESLMRRRLGETAAVAPAVGDLVRDGLARQLDLLANAEARHPALRLRHAELAALVTGVERLLTAAILLEDAPLPGPVPEAAARRLHAVAASCAALATALRARSAHVPPPALETATDDEVGAEAALLLPAIVDLERVLEPLPAALGFLTHPDDAPVRRSVLDAQRRPFLLPAFFAPPPSDVEFALRAGLAACAAYVLWQGLVWQGISTCVVTVVIVAQSTLGASVQKSILRAAGAALGGLLGLAAIVVAIPNLTTLPGLLVVVAAGTAVGGWLNAGSSRIAYAGLQTGLAFALCLLDRFAPSTALVTPRDRVLGVFLGIAVAAVGFGAFGARLAGAALVRKLGETLRTLAELARAGGRDADPAPASTRRRQVYDGLATVLRLLDEAKFEPADAVESARQDAVLHAAGSAQEAFLALLAVVRHRFAVDFEAAAPLAALDDGVADYLDALAGTLLGTPAARAPDLAALLRAADSGTSAPGAAPAHLVAHLALHRVLVDRLLALGRAVDAVAPGAVEPVHGTPAPAPA